MNKKNQIQGIFLLSFLCFSLSIFSQTDPAILWQSGATDRVYGSPVFVNNQVFVGSIDGRLNCIDQASGRQYYRVDMGGIINSTPIVFNENIILIAGNDLVCFNPTDVEEVWRFSPEGDNLIARFDEWDYHHSSPILYNNLVYFGSSNGHLYAVNPETGELTNSWQTTDNSPIRTEANVVDSIVYFGDWDGRIYALDLETSQYKWTVRTWTGADFNNFAGILSRIEVGEDIIYYGARNQTIKAINKNTGSTVWEYESPDGGWISGDPLLYGDLLLIAGSDNHKMLCFNASNGTLLWNFEFPGNCFSKPLIVNDKIIFTTGNAYANSGLNFGRGFIHSLNLPSGELFKEIEFSGNVFSSPILNKGIIYFGCDNKNLFAVDGYELAGIETSHVSLLDSDSHSSDLYNFRNYPNPFKSDIQFAFSLPMAKDVSILIYDLNGKQVYSMDLSHLGTGEHLIARNIPNDLPHQYYLANLYLDGRLSSSIKLMKASN